MSSASNKKKTLMALLESPDPGTVISAIRELAKEKDPKIRSRLISFLATTDAPVIRNALALELSDRKELGAFPVLVKLLDDIRTENSRGTLLYALGAYDCSPILEQLVHQVITGNFEVARQAFSLISSTEGNISEATWKNCVTKISTALRHSTPEQRPILLELLSMFSEQDEAADH